MTASIVGTGGSISAGATATITAGVANFAGLTLKGVAGNTYTLSYSNGTLNVSDPTVITMHFGAATQLVITTQPVETKSAGNWTLTTQPVVKVEDSSGNVVTSATGTMTASITGGTPVGVTISGTNVAIISGVATYSTLNISFSGAAKSFTLQFTGDALTSPVSSSL
jgi:hypothetical protein